MSPPRTFLIVRWRYAPNGKPVEFPIKEDSYPTLDAVAADLFDGQIEDVEQVVSVDLDTCSAFDLTNDAFSRAADLSFEREEEPSDALARQFDAKALRYYGLAKREADYLRDHAIEMRIDAARERRWEASQ